MILLYDFILIITILVIWFIYNNLKFNLAGVQFSQGVHHFIKNNSFDIVFIKPENLTKTELVKQVKDLSASKVLAKNKLDSNNKNKDSLQNLINQIKNYFSQIIELILTFKNLLLKLTLISLIIGSLKRYKIFRRLWFAINTIVMAIFGISLFENTLFNFILDFITEIRFISWNIVDYLSHTKFYNYLSKLFSNNEIIDKEVINNKNIINNENKNIINNKNKELDYKISSEDLKIKKPDFTKEPVISRLSEWLKPQTDVIEQADISSDSSYKKYIYITGIIIATSLAWYYSDEIKSSFTSLMEWILSFRTRPDDSSRDDSNSGNTHIGSNLPIETSKTDTGIEVVETIDKGKGKVLSPSASFDNLHEKVRESWSHGSSSPSSSSSNETITPLNINTSNTISSLDILEYIKRNWRKRLDDDIQNQINFIETSEEFTDKIKLVEYFTNIVCEHNKDVETYEFMKESGNYQDNLEQLKHSLFYLREWIAEYQGIILPESTIIEKGSIIDSP